MRPLDGIGSLRNAPYRVARSDVVFTDDSRVLMLQMRRFESLLKMIQFVKSTGQRLWVADCSITPGGVVLKCALDKKKTGSRFGLVII